MAANPDGPRSTATTSPGHPNPGTTLESRLALLQLSSVALPVGGYSYSQGLEMAIEDGVVTTTVALSDWISSMLRTVLARYEAPLWWRLYRAARQADPTDFDRWNEEFIATRETRELRAETIQMGHSMRSLCAALEPCTPYTGPEPICWPAAHARCAALWQVDGPDALAGYLFGWAENQVMVALKAIPIGQTDGQRILMAQRPEIASAVERAALMQDDELSAQAPMLAIFSARHETQYSRLFRS